MDCGGHTKKELSFFIHRPHTQKAEENIQIPCKAGYARIVRKQHSLEMGKGLSDQGLFGASGCENLELIYTIMWGETRNVGRNHEKRRQKKQKITRPPHRNGERKKKKKRGVVRKVHKEGSVTNVGELLGSCSFVGREETR
jgi:hypothetical protein